VPGVIKRIRQRFGQRFGISAPRMMVRTHLAWYWRWLGMVVFAAVSLALAAWMYDAGRRFAGFDRSELEDEVQRLRTAVSRFEEETAKLRAVANAGDSRLKIEQSAQAQLARQVKGLEEENRRLQEDLAFFENLAPATDRLTINRFTVRPDILPGEFRYRLLVLLGSERRERQFQGSLQLVLNVQVQGRNGMIVLPESGQPENAAFRLNFKYFQRVEGTFRVPPDTRVQSVQVRVLENGSSQARATQSVDLS
jgi:hypothetical protein